MIATFSAQDVPANLSRETATGLYRIAEEALDNVARHAGKTHVRVTLKGAPSAVTLQIADAGEGFDMQARRDGLGLIGMEERARMLDGAFQIESHRGAGTKITVEIPRPKA